MISRSKTLVGAEEVEELTRKRLEKHAWAVGMFDRFRFGFEVSGSQEIG